MTQVYVKDDPFTGSFNDPNFLSRGYDWDDFQLHGFEAISKGHDLLVCAPTASGKTILAEYALIRHALGGGKVIFTTPIKTLSNEKFSEIKELLVPHGIMPGLLTGDHKINIDSPVIIATAEILRNSLYKLKNPNENNSMASDITDQVTCVIMDEVHYINDPSRGYVWEETIALLSKNVQLVMLSATIDKPELFADWIRKIKDKNITIVKKDKRPVPLNYYVFDGENINKLENQSKFDYSAFRSSRDICKKFKKTASRQDMINEMLKLCKKQDLFQCLIIVFSQALCTQYANESECRFGEDIHDTHTAIKEFDSRFGMFKDIYKNLPVYIELRRLVGKGICYHHSGLIPIFKEVIESLYRDGIIKVLFATETFAVGVNMPVRTVILSDISKYSEGGMRNLRPDEFKQICGRAGRRGKDTTGTAILMPLNTSFFTETEVTELIYGKMPSIQSQLVVNYNTFLKLKQSPVTNEKEFYALSLKNNQLSRGHKDVYVEILETQERLDKFGNSFDSDMKKNLDRYAYLVEVSKGNVTIGNFPVSCTKKDKKEMLKLKKIIDSYGESAKQAEQKNRIEQKLLDLKSSYETMTGGLTDAMYCKLAVVCQKLGLLEQNGTLTPKGVLASHVNECECAPLLLEIFYQISNCQDITAPEIAAILSILLDKTRFERDSSLHIGHDKSVTDMSVDNHMKNMLLYEEDAFIKSQVDCTPIVRSIIKQVIEFANKSNDIECSEQLALSKNYWETSLGYVELAYNWTNNAELKDILEDLDYIGENLGTFVRNMMKIYNLFDELVKLANDTGNADMIAILEDGKTNIQRSIVNNHSLHVTE